MEPVCAVCNKVAPQKCAACLSVSYCSVEHQRQHWKMHRKECTNFRIVDDAKLGKCMIATKDMKAGAAVLEEKAVLVAVPWEVTAGNEAGLITACFTCGLAQKVGEYMRKCSKCKWPICSADCEKFWIHSENECKIFASKGLSYPPPFPPDCIGDVLKGIRACMLKRKDPQLYQQIFELCSEYSLPTYEEPDPTENALMKLLANVENAELDREELKKLMKIIQINCYSASYINTENRLGGRQRKQSTTGIYLKSSRFNHSCIPNCDWQLSSKPDYKIRICTTTAVRKGDPLTVSYWMENIPEATRGRQELIRSKGHFICECTRCLDPTELGTYMSGIVCNVCKGEGAGPSGYYLPENPLDVSDSSIWKCNGCQDIKQSVAILPVVEDMGRMIACMQRVYGDNPYDEILINFCKTMISTNSDKVLHPNHWAIQNAMRAVCSHLQRNPMKFMSLEWRQCYIQYSKHLLCVEELVSSGLTFSGAMLHDGIAIALQLQCSNLHAQENYEQMEKTMEECLKHLGEVVAYYKTGFSSNRVEGCETLAALAETRISCIMKDLTVNRFKKLKQSRR